MFLIPSQVIPDQNHRPGCSLRHVERIDAPEVRGRCGYETDLAAQARERLGIVLGDRQLRIERNGQDRYGRTLARVRIGNGYAGDVLVGEGLARLWTGRKEEWCAG